MQLSNHCIAPPDIGDNIIAIMNASNLNGEVHYFGSKKPMNFSDAGMASLDTIVAPGKTA